MYWLIVLFLFFIDLWLSYIEYKYAHTSTEANTQSVSDIYWRAKRELNADIVEMFTQKLCLLKINLESSLEDVDMKYE